MRGRVTTILGVWMDHIQLYKHYLQVSFKYFTYQMGRVLKSCKSSLPLHHPNPHHILSTKVHSPKVQPFLPLNCFHQKDEYLTPLKITILKYRMDNQSTLQKKYSNNLKTKFLDVVLTAEVKSNTRL